MSLCPLVLFFPLSSKRQLPLKFQDGPKQKWPRRYWLFDVELFEDGKVLQSLSTFDISVWVEYAHFAKDPVSLFCAAPPYFDVAIYFFLPQNATPEMDKACVNHYKSLVSLQRQIREKQIEFEKKVGAISALKACVASEI